MSEGTIVIGTEPTELEPDASNDGRVLVHVFGLASWWSIPADTEIERIA